MIIIIYLIKFFKIRIKLLTIRIRVTREPFAKNDTSFPFDYGLVFTVLTP